MQVFLQRFVLGLRRFPLMQGFLPVVVRRENLTVLFASFGILSSIGGMMSAGEDIYTLYC